MFYLDVVMIIIVLREFCAVFSHYMSFNAVAL